MAYTSTSSLGEMSSPSSSSFQEGDGIKKSGNIILLTGNKKRGQSAYAVLSERALELHESEKAHRKKKGNRAIVDLSKCFNVSQQNCPKTRVPCVCLLMPDECFLFRAENAHETAEWYCNLLSTIISSRALHLGRPVFANEFFECVWDVTVCPQQPPKLKKVPAPPNNSTEFANSINICGKLPELAGHKRLCFYPHTIIICKIGIEPAHSGLPKSGIPPFRTMDFVEFSRHFIAQYGQVDKYFLMRIGRSSPMGACEVWIQCESEDTAIEVNRKLQEIIQRETEKKQQALMTIRGQQQQQQAVGQQHLINDQRLLPSCLYTSHYSITPVSIPNSPSSTASPMTSPSNAGNSGRIVEKTGSFPLSVSGIEQLEPISENEQQNNTNQTTARKKCPSSLSQSAREKRLELRERKAKIDSLEEEEQRFQQRQMLVQKQQQQAAGWTPTKRYMAIKSLDPNAYRTSETLTGAAIISRPNCLFDQQAKTITKGYQIRRRGSSGGLETENSARSKSLGLEEHSQKQSFHPFGGVANRLWSMDKADSLLLLGYGQAEEETEDSGGTLRMIPCDQEGSQAASRSNSSLNLFAANPTSQTAADTTMHSSSRSSSAGQLVETYVECHASIKNDDEENSNNGSSTSSAEEEGIDHHYHHEEKARQKLQRRKVNARRQQRQLMTTSGADESPDGGTEADQSCSCSESLASSSGRDEQRQQQLSLAQPNVDTVEKKHSCPIEQQQQFSNPNATLEYNIMDKVSCSSDSFSHLVVPQQQWDRQDGSNYFPEEICSYTSDSADSCYSSMANGQLNPRAFSFSSTTDAVPARAHFGPNKLVGKPHSSQTQSHQLQHPAAAKWTAAMAHRNYLFQHQQQPTAHFSPPKFCNSGQQMSSAQQHLDSSSSSRFSMETSLTTPLEEDEQQVTLADEEQRGQTSNFSPKPTTVDADDSLRKRAFSLGSKSWITKPFSKLTSSHGTSSIGRQQRNSYGGGTSRSGSSSLVGSMHADLCSVQEQSSQTQLSHKNRLGSASSFASSSAAGPVNSRDLHTRSDSIGSNHSAAVSLPGLSHRLRKKQPSEEHLKNEDLVELEFMPSKMPFSNRSSQYVATTPTDHSLRGRTSSYDDQQSSNNNVIVSGYCTQQNMLPSEGQYCVAVRAPPGRGSACSLNHTIGAGTSTAQQLQGWQQQQRLRPSESFIRSIQQQQKKLQKVRQQKQRQRLRNDFPLQEVQCFIAPAEREKIDALTSRDSLSIRSQRSGSGSCSQHFETIDECMTGASLNLQQQPQTEAVVKKHRTNSRMSSKSTHSTSSASPESQLSTIIGSGANNDGDYILGKIKSGETTSTTMTA